MFTKLQKASISNILSVSLSTWNNSVPTGQISIKSDI